MERLVDVLYNFQTLQEEMTGAVFHPLDDNLLITHGKGHLTFWNRRKDGFFERTDIIKPVGFYLLNFAFSHYYFNLKFSNFFSFYSHLER